MIHYYKGTPVLQNKELLAQQHNVTFLTLPNFTIFIYITNIIHFPVNIIEITGDQLYEFWYTIPSAGEKYFLLCASKWDSNLHICSLHLTRKVFYSTVMFKVLLYTVLMNKQQWTQHSTYHYLNQHFTSSSSGKVVWRHAINHNILHTYIYATLDDQKNVYMSFYTKHIFTFEEGWFSSLWCFGLQMTKFYLWSKN
jgi:hypothetical protein